MKILIFGAGGTGKWLFDEHVLVDRIDEVVAFIDNNTNKWNTYIFENVRVIAPSDIGKCEFERIVIASNYETEIKEQLVNLGYGEYILLINEYLRQCHVRKVYEERYLLDGKQSISRVFKGRCVVYTAITGDYDALNEPSNISSNYDYICFTNNKEMHSNVWKMKYVSDGSLDNMLLAKRIKMFPNEYLSEYDTSIWIDGKFKIVDDLMEYVRRYERTQAMLCFPHFERNCIYEEAARCIVDGIGIKQDIIHQISSYEHKKYPVNNGLYEMGCIVRKHNESEVKELMSKWWKHVMKYSFRDQISFPYVCWENGYLPDICDQDLYNNKWLKCTRNYSKIVKVQK